MKKLFQLILLIALIAGCKSVKEIRKSYELFQTGFDSSNKFTFKDLSLKVGDNISVNVYSLASSNQEQVGLFYVLSKAGTYTVNNQGTIDFPKVGTLNVVGLTCNQLKEKLKNEWSRYIKEIAVDVQLNGFSVNVLGQVANEGARKFTSERATILDAISLAGGLPDDAKRNNVLVIREDSGRRVAYTLDLRDAKMYESPAFQLQQNDMIYVNADDRKFASIKGKNLRENVQPVAQVTGLVFTFINFLVLVFALNK